MSIHNKEVKKKKRIVTAKQMANLRPAKKGEPTRNPEGARAHNQVFKALKHIGRKQFQDIIEIALKEDVDALRVYSKNTKLSTIQFGVCKALVDAADRGDWAIFKDIVEQIVGKVPEVHHVISENSHSAITDKEFLERRKRLLEDV